MFLVFHIKLCVLADESSVVTHDSTALNELCVYYVYIKSTPHPPSSIAGGTTVECFEDSEETKPLFHLPIAMYLKKPVLGVSSKDCT